MSSAGWSFALPTLSVRDEQDVEMGWVDVVSATLFVVFAVITYRNVEEIRDAESAIADIIEPPIVSPAGESEIATARVRFCYRGGDNRGGLRDRRSGGIGHW